MAEEVTRGTRPSMRSPRRSKSAPSTPGEARWAQLDPSTGANLRNPHTSGSGSPVRPPMRGAYN